MSAEDPPPLAEMVALHHGRQHVPLCTQQATPPARHSAAACTPAAGSPPISGMLACTAARSPGHKMTPEHCQGLAVLQGDTSLGRSRMHRSTDPGLLTIWCTCPEARPDYRQVFRGDEFAQIIYLGTQPEHVCAPPTQHQYHACSLQLSTRKGARAPVIQGSAACLTPGNHLVECTQLQTRLLICSLTKPD
jgi:hypothetical protein